MKVFGSVLAFALLIAACQPTTVEQAEEAPAEVLFTDVTLAAGLGGFRHETGAFGRVWMPETMGAGGGFLDYDGDGLTDIVLIAGGVLREQDPPFAALRLYRSSGDGSFEEVTAEAGLGSLHAYAFGITAADYDNDGDTDIFVATLAENLLLRNDGGVFIDVAAEAGLKQESLWSSAAVFFDADRDGWLDLFVGHYVEWSPESDIYCSRVEDRKSYCTPEAYPGVSSRFYHNNGDGTFSDRSDLGSFGTAPGKTLAALSLDYNRDGWPDLVVANDTQRDLLFVNQGDGSFEERGVPSGIAFDENGRARAGMGIDAGVVDETGETTVFVGHFSAEMVGVYRHAMDGFFVDRAAISRIGRPSLPTLTFGLFLFDADLDSDLDLFTANGHITEDIEKVEEGILYRQQSQLYLNSGEGFFTVMAPGAANALSTFMIARGAAWADYDRDGDIDILVTENGGPARLWRNELEGGNYLRVRLEGSVSNRDGIGGRVVAHVAGTHLERYVRSGSSYLSQPQVDAHFGLGSATAVDSLTVYWPSGSVTRLGFREANRQLHLVEDAIAPR